MRKESAGRVLAFFLPPCPPQQPAFCQKRNAIRATIRRAGWCAATSFLDLVREEHPDYWCKPVAPFGDARARLVIVGLAPGMHGANASGRPFTGDYAGIPVVRRCMRSDGRTSLTARPSATGSRCGIVG